MRFLRPLLFAALLLGAATAANASSPFEGRWRLDPARSSALDGWQQWDLVISVTGTQVSLRHDMQWIATKVSAINVVDTARPTSIADFFRVEQRHMALYPVKDHPTPVSAAWLDDHRTLRVEAQPLIEGSQGNFVMRIYSEYRLVEGDNALLLIELHSTRSRPLVYRFTKVPAEK
ncbi:hypothetical protein [Opitutus terrae]|uniref:Uncharacterized protein n=1 Tax=Opitutus terrae (strain DSM 11246 / JCM 15787 / PB90-1) TaxID=452637 RepID=B1ZY29_OPITP|nr:hypothetical protein [Opitutus terrae]ACB76178.1 hypothetical protein Oter_2897 [Opitutus terrae PB90-1]